MDALDNISGIIFDCDGVMIDSAGANRFLYNQILQYLGLPPLTREQEQFAFQATFSQALQALVPDALQSRIEEACKAAIHYDRDILPRISLMPGYTRFIDLAHRHGLRLAIDSNRTEAGIHKVLDFFHLPNYFDPIISSSDYEPKPSPAGALAICDAWKVQPSQVLFIGDSPDDRLAAEGAGMIFVGFGGIPGSVTVSAWSELETMLWSNMETGRTK